MTSPAIEQLCTADFPPPTVLRGQLRIQHVPYTEPSGTRYQLRLQCEDFSQHSSAVAVPAAQRGLGIDRSAADVDLEMEVATDRDRVAGLPHRADPLASPDPLAPVDQGRAGHVGVEVAAVLAFAVDQQVVAVEDRVVAAAQDAAVADGDQRRVAAGDDVEALVGTAAAARGAEFADPATAAVRALDREDVVVVGDGTVAAGEVGRCGSGKRREEEES
jgi:hypothetical protein